MSNYIAEIINLSMKNRKIVANYPILRSRSSFGGGLILDTIAIPEENLEEAIRLFQQNLGTALHKEWYLTIHSNEKIIVVFREMVFRLGAEGIHPVNKQCMDTTNAKDKTAWDELLQYAKSLGVPPEQCDFLPEDYAELDYNFTVTCKAFGNMGDIPIEHTGFGSDVSPELRVSGISEKAVSMVILMDDLDISMVPNYSHWVVWNLPPMECIPGSIPRETVLPKLGNAIQGNGYGKHRYRGPKQPPFVKSAHRYRFMIYTLDVMLDMGHNSNRKQVFGQMEGHILQTGGIVGNYYPPHGRIK